MRPMKRLLKEPRIRAVFRMANMEIIFKKTAELKPYKKNPRVNDEAVEATKKSILLHGFINPLIIGKDDVIIAGHTRLKAAKQMGLQELPCIVMDEEDPDLIRQYRIVDNKTAEKSSWNIPKLIEELSGLQEMDLSAFKFGDFGFGDDEDAADPDEEAEGYQGNLGVGVEVNLEDFDDETFEYECPWCGFKWNE